MSGFTSQVFGVGIPMVNGVVNTVEYIQSTYGKNNIVCLIEWIWMNRHG